MKKIIIMTGIAACLVMGSARADSGLAAANGYGASEAPEVADNVYDMFQEGTFSGDIKLLSFFTRNSQYVQGKNPSTSTLGGRLAFETSELNGFQLKLGVVGQKNIYKTFGGNRDMGNDEAALGEAYVKWSHGWGDGRNFSIVAGNQDMHGVPFAEDYDYRVVPQLYQGLRVKYSTPNYEFQLIKVSRFKSRISNGYSRTTNYNDYFDPYGSNPTTRKTNGDWGGGVSTHHEYGGVALKGEAWYFNYQNYAKLSYVQGTLGASDGDIKPFVSLQYMRETSSGNAYLGNVDSRMYGVQLGFVHHTLKASLNFDHVPHEDGAFGYGQLVTPYAHAEVSGPIFAQPLFTSTQDLGSGNAYSMRVSGSPIKNFDLLFLYSYMDLKASALSKSIGQSEVVGDATYHLSGVMKNFSIKVLTEYQIRRRVATNSWENRLYLEYKF